jgi:hypothetical protein
MGKTDDKDKNEDNDKKKNMDTTKSKSKSKDDKDKNEENKDDLDGPEAFILYSDEMTLAELKTKPCVHLRD